MHKYLLFTILLLVSLTGKAQELNCRVQVLTPSIQGTNKQVFQTLQTAIYEFMNNTKWTNDQFAVEERIECSITINITEQLSTDEFKGTLQVQSSRPAFNSSYNSTLLNVFDDQFRFRYLEFQAMEFNENTHISNLTSVLAFYAYTIIGMDYDSFGKRAGQPYFLKAQKVVNNAQNDNAATGWKAFEGNQNRYWLNENLLNPNFRPLRDCTYAYHRKGLDLMSNQVETGRAAIMEAIINLRSVHNKQPNSYLMQMFFAAKSDEIVNIFKKELPVNKTSLLEVLKIIDPANTTKYEGMMRAE